MDDDEPRIERVLIANRGEIARRLNRYFQEREIETVVAFSEPEAELEYLDDADYAVYLNGRTVEETYEHVQRVVASAHDASADAIHPGYCFLAENPEFASAAYQANLPIVGGDARALVHAVDRTIVRALAQRLSIPLIPGSGPIGPDDEPIPEAAQLGLPLFVKAVTGQVMERVTSLDEIPAAIERVRKANRTEDQRVVLERVVDSLRQIGTVVVGDRHGTCVHLGHTDASMEVSRCTWIEEMGPAIVDKALGEKLGEAAVKLASALDWVGVGRVRWAVLPDGGWYLLGFSARLTTGYSLVEQVHSIDLIDAQVRSWMGEPLGWVQEQSAPSRHGIQLRIFHLDPADPSSRPEGVLESVEVPETDGVEVEWGAELGQALTELHDPLLLKITVTGPTRQAAVVRAKAALDEVAVEGVATNLPLLEAVLGRQSFWDGSYDVHTLQKSLQAPSP